MTNFLPVPLPGTSNPVPTSYALSTSTQDIYPSYSAADRLPAISATQGWEGAIVQEPNAFLMTYQGTTYYCCIYTGGTTNQSLGFAYTTSPVTNGGVWTKPLTTPVIGNGNGGLSAGQYCAHTGLYIENGTLYVTTSIAPFTGSLLLFSAPYPFNPATGPIFTQVGNAMSLPAGSTSWGNSAIIPVSVGSQYALLYESLRTSDSVYYTGAAQLNAALGSGLFTSQAYPLTTLSSGVSWFGPSDTKEAGGPVLAAIENNTVVLYYHAGPSGANPTDVFAATIPIANIFTDGWTVLNQGFPVMRRESQAEVDQCADPSLMQGPGGEFWLMTTAYDNLNQKSSILCTPCYPAAITTSNGQKVYMNRPIDSYNERGFNQAIFPGANTTTYTPRNRDVVIFNLGINSVTVTLPRASWNTKIKIGAFNASGGRQVTVNASGGDTLIGANTVQGGTIVTYNAENKTWWMTDNPPFGSPTTGAQTATFTATNKPGTGTNSPIAWMPITYGGTTGYIPIFGA